MKRLIAVHEDERWRDYLRSRLHEYLDSACAQSDDNLEISSAQVVLPAKFDARVAIEHDLDVRLFQRQGPATDGWYYRADAYSLAAERLLELSKAEDRSWLICYSEHSIPTDGVLKKRRHNVLGDRVFLLSDLSSDPIEKIAKILRQSRSNKIFAVLSDDPKTPCDFAQNGIFCTDVFDGDALVVCRIRTVSLSG